MTPIANLKRAWRAALACGCLLLAAAALPPEPPSKVYVPGNEKLFQQGVDAFDAGDYGTAFNIFSELAGQDDIAAMRNVALMERKGLGTAKDPKAALKMYERAASAGLPTAAADLGQMLLDGEAGPPDPKAALPWLLMAAEASHPVAQYLLGEMYEQGEGVKQDYNKAEQFYAAAAAHGSRRAAARLSYLKGWPQPQSAAPVPAPPAAEAGRQKAASAGPKP